MGWECGKGRKGTYVTNEKGGLVPFSKGRNCFFGAFFEMNHRFIKSHVHLQGKRKLYKPDMNDARTRLSTLVNE